MEVGDKASLTATPVPENADDINMIWSVDKPEVISVTEEGYIEALSSGTAVITIASTDGKIEKMCTVCVKTHATDAAIEPSQVIFTNLGDIAQLQAVVLPEETYDKSVKWTSSNPSVCTVTTQGKLVAMGYGDAVVMAVTNDGEIPATCVVKVMAGKPKLTYMVDGVEYQSDEHEAGESVSLMTAPEKEGNVFIGWSLAMPSEDVTLTAVYAPASSIDAVKAASASFLIFTTDGIPMNELQQGVNIIRYADGQTKKVIVK
ncbi:MAG: Ig-like domain-containing protein [Bacteroidaceae bacterium]|nr:Ig-like domain-containing protein [Bacteroidaceae bacterium]